MFVVNDYATAVILCIVTMLCWGSWGNTQKLAGRTWRYELFYWDYVVGMLLFSLILCFTLGSIGSEGRPFLEDLAQAAPKALGSVLLGGVIFNASNILLSASVSLAGLAVAARHGFEMENGTQYARDRYVDVNIFDERHRKVLARLNRLPASCEESARRLEEHRAVYERHGVFSPRLIDGLVARLAAFRDADLRRELAGDEEKVRKLVETYFYCG